MTTLAAPATEVLPAAPPLQPWIGGREHPTATTLAVLDPATGLPLAEVGDTDPAEAPVAVDAAAAALPGWAATPPRVRSECLMRAFTLMRDEAEDLAGNILGLIIAVMFGMVVLGMLLAAPLTRILTPGFSGPQLELATTLLRIAFPAISLSVLSAYCTGILNSHRKFFLSYASPVMWNLGQIGFVAAAGIMSARHDLRSPDESGGAQCTHEQCLEFHGAFHRQKRNGEAPLGASPHVKSEREDVEARARMHLLQLGSGVD